jgi:hypothetical protein
MINYANDHTKTVTSPFISVMSPGTGKNNDDPIQRFAFMMFPVVMVVICIFTMFSICNKLMGLVGLNKYVVPYLTPFSFFSQALGSAALMISMMKILIEEGIL